MYLNCVCGGWSKLVVPPVISKQTKKTLLQLSSFSQVQIQTLGCGNRFVWDLPLQLTKLLLICNVRIFLPVAYKLGGSTSGKPQLLFKWSWLHISLGLHANDFGNPLGGDNGHTPSVASELGSSCLSSWSQDSVNLLSDGTASFQRNDKESIGTVVN